MAKQGYSPKVELVRRWFNGALSAPETSSACRSEACYRPCYRW